MTSETGTCGICAGSGTGSVGGAPCPHCLGAGVLTFERALHLAAFEYRHARRADKKASHAHGEIVRLRALLEDATGDGRSWATYAALLKTIRSLQETVRHMAARITELGGGNAVKAAVHELNEAQIAAEGDFADEPAADAAFRRLYAAWATLRDVACLRRPSAELLDEQG